MSCVTSDLHIFFLPFPTHGHIIPTIDMARLFSAHGVKATIITTQLHKPITSLTQQNPKLPNHLTIHIKTIEFPDDDSAFPQVSPKIDFCALLKATMKLKEPLEKLLLEEHPHCLVADMFFPWATDSASKFGIPTLVFHGTGLFPLCTSLSVTSYEPYKYVSSDSEPFLIPNVPGEIKMTKRQLTELSRIEDEEKTITKLLSDSRESEVRSFGIVANSFYELESVYIEHYRKVFGRRVWVIGPVSLCNRKNEEKAQRGSGASIDEEQGQCLNWLASKKPKSVVFLCFGSTGDFSNSQLLEIARGLEDSGQEFIWVVRRGRKDAGEEETEEWLPEGFEKRMEGKGLIIRGWAPQVLILEDEAIGAFVTHCGWNSTLEGVVAGLPMVTWPLGAEQFYNEKFVTEILKIGVCVGAEIGDFVENGKIESALNRVMVGEEAEDLRNRAKCVAVKAREAVELGGSSHSDLISLIQQLHHPSQIKSRVVKETKENDELKHVKEC